MTTLAEALIGAGLVNRQDVAKALAEKELNKDIEERSRKISLRSRIRALAKLARKDSASWDEVEERLLELRKQYPDIFDQIVSEESFRLHLQGGVNERSFDDGSSHCP